MDMSHTSNGNYQGLNTNYAIQNKFVCFVPVSNALGKEFKDLELNITRWTLPQINVGSSQIQFKGYTIAVPTHIMNAEDKELTVEYIVDANWRNYSALYKWACQESPFVPIDNNSFGGSSPNSAPFNKSDLIDFKQCLIDVRIWLIDSYKKRIVDFVYHDCWISQFLDLAMDVASTSEIKHSFTCKYSYFTIESPLL